MKKIFKKLVSSVLVMALTLTLSAGIVNFNTKGVYAATSSKVTYANFLKVKLASKYSDLTKILGAGTLKEKNKENGVEIAMYEWTTSNKQGIIDLMFGDGKLVMKMQTGLRDVNAKVTLKEYNSVANSMTYSKVKAILGSGTLQISTMQGENKVDSYLWKNSDGSFAVCNFENNKLTLKAQYGLK